MIINRLSELVLALADAIEKTTAVHAIVAKLTVLPLPIELRMEAVATYDRLNPLTLRYTALGELVRKLQPYVDVETYRRLVVAAKGD